MHLLTVDLDAMGLDGLTSLHFEGTKLKAVGLEGDIKKGPVVEKTVEVDIHTNNRYFQYFNSQWEVKT